MHESENRSAGHAIKLINKGINVEGVHCTVLYARSEYNTKAKHFFIFNPCPTASDTLLMSYVMNIKHFYISFSFQKCRVRESGGGKV
jgi:hypothetical protein